MQYINMLISQILFRPIFNVLIVFLAIFGGNLGIAIILLTLLVRGVMYKSSLAGVNMQKGMSNIQPKVEELQEKYKDNPQKLSEETMKLFKTEGKAPLKGCLTMLIQIPIFIGLYTVVRKFANADIPADWLYSFFYSFGAPYVDPANIDHYFLGMDLYAKGNIVLMIIVMIVNYAQMRLTNLVQPQQKLPGTNAPDMKKMMGMMSIMMSVVMGVMVYSLNSAIGIYLLTSGLFSVIQYSIRYWPLIKAKRYQITKKPIVIQK